MKTEDKAADAESKSLQQCARLEVLNELVEIVDQSPYFASQYLAFILNCWNCTIMRRLTEFGYKNMWSTWLHRNMSSIMIEEF